MLICKSQAILNDYYNDIFHGLKSVEKEFGFNLKGMV